MHLAPTHPPHPALPHPPTPCAVRLIGSLVGSYPLLAEGLSSVTEGAGAGLLLAALTWYLLRQKRAADEAAAAAMEAEAALQEP